MMKNALFLLMSLLLVLAMTLLASVGFARKLPEKRVQFTAVPEAAILPPDLARQSGRPRTTAPADTFLLGDFRFDTGEMGFIHLDRTDQIKAFFHVADGTELNGGTFGNLLPLSGSKSMWCGEPASTALPFCGYAALPGYGNGWNQILQADFVSGDSVTFGYNVFWDSEGNYDGTEVQVTFNGGAYWSLLPVTDTFSERPALYDNTAPAGGITEYFAVGGSAGTDNVGLRFVFESDGLWSDEDGLWPTDGAVIVDNISVEYFSGGVSVDSDLEDFESAETGSNTAGIWTGMKAPAFGDFAALYPGVSLLQEDPCVRNLSSVWGFFDDPLFTNYACHLPDPRPDVGAMPWGSNARGYLYNEVASPRMPNIGSGDEYRLSFLVYRDLPLDNLQFYTWSVRSWKSGCPGQWRDFNFVYYGGGRDWLRATFPVGSLIDPTADEIQVAVGAIDMCPVWFCFPVVCHSHAPLIDDVRLERIDLSGPQYAVRHINLFQDNFAADGTLTGAARADAAIDILPSTSPGILPGDSAAITVFPVGANTLGAGGGPAVYTYVTVQPFSQVGKTPADLESQHTRGGSKRYPLVGTTVVSGVTWGCFRMDSVLTTLGGVLEDQYCFDLNDNVFTPGDTVQYFFGADWSGGAGDEAYFSRTMSGQGSNFATSDINEALASPMEFTILPAGGYNRGGDILYVDDTDDRGGPAELFFDSAFDMLGIRDLIDRYDTVGPSSAVGNGLGSRVKNNVTQIIDIYSCILWNSGNLSSATIGDGTGNPEKSNDFLLLNSFLALSTKDPGLFISGDDIASEWVTLAGADAIAMKATFMDFGFSVVDDDHVNHGEAVSPLLTAVGTGAFAHSGVGDKLVAYGGCALINTFDVLTPVGASTKIEWPYPISGDAAVLSQTTGSPAAASTAKVVLSGFSYNYIRDNTLAFPPARTEFLKDLLAFFGKSTGPATGVPGPQFANALYNNYPNPFNPTTTIKYSIKERAHVSLRIYNAAGQLVKTLVNQVQAPDKIKPVTWDGRNNAGQTVSSGVYFYKMVTKNFSQTKKMVILR